jgi:putative SOS response-associated peptidase YedK
VSHLAARQSRRESRDNQDENTPPWTESAPIFGFLTTDANTIVAPIHPKAMPVILTPSAEIDQWLEAETSDALALQRPLADGAIRIVAKGKKEDAL